MNKVVLYCRPGFEKECAAEITDKAARLEVFGFARVKDDSGYVIFECYQAEDGEKLVRELPFSSLVFARQMFVVGELLRDLPPEDRISRLSVCCRAWWRRAASCAWRSPTPTKAKN
jgi:23S rRNA (cytidine2498-2'-O)-methyltransferase